MVMLAMQSMIALTALIAQIDSGHRLAGFVTKTYFG
jgi:hypothetical protein